jgi:hypothetical protein
MLIITLKNFSLSKKDLELSLIYENNEHYIEGLFVSQLASHMANNDSEIC